MENLFLRINGRGNAWPVSLGQQHPFYSTQNYEDLANASFSLIGNTGVELSKENVDWEILIDAGHGAVQYLLQHQNRIPEAIVLTHPHMDHTLGVDWIAQSFYSFNKKRKYPVYATKRCWEFVVQSFPHLKSIIEFNELKAGIKVQVKEVDQLFLTSYPVYHGESAFGSSLLVFEERSGGENRKIVVTGDILCPMLTHKAVEHVQKAALLVTDSNNRFPYPGTNHWSVMDNISTKKGLSKYLNVWLKNIQTATLLRPHLLDDGDNCSKRYFEEFFGECKSFRDLPLSIFEFVKRINPKQIALVHYSGLEDSKYYNQPVFSDVDLQNWVNIQAKKIRIPENFVVPKVGDVFLI